MAKSVKSIKAATTKQIKKAYPNFNNMKKDEKKDILEKTWEDLKNCNFEISDLPLTEEDTLGIFNIPDNIININRMGTLISEFRDKHYYLNSKIDDIKDPELKDLEQLIDWNLINYLLADEKYTPGRRKIFPFQFFKAELLKQLKYAEIAYRKYDPREINNPERKENRAFLGLKDGQKITHDQLSKFRGSIEYARLINILVYFIVLFLEHKDLGENSLHAVDSTELPVKVNPFPLFKTTFGGEKVRFFSDIDADLGTRRNKRDKSKFIIGYRMHTLTVIDPKTQEAYPLISVLAAANHHDSNFLKVVLKLSRAIGLNVTVVVADQAYGSEQEYEDFYEAYGVTLLNAPKETVIIPAHVEKKNGEVLKDSQCTFPMEYVGKDEQNGHEFHCNAPESLCPLQNCCTQVRFIPVDSGQFGLLPLYHLSDAKKALDMRKVAERPFNLIKHRDGLEPLRTRGLVNSTFVALSSNITTLLIEIAGFRKKNTKTTENRYSKPA
ncbi:transposase [Patescibacteria group bacterium]|nr:transposase [Patescibacteria group bacterium]MBU1683154.1 transposase [Patescibacteria group bacterium]